MKGAWRAIQQQGGLRQQNIRILCACKIKSTLSLLVSRVLVPPTDLLCVCVANPPIRMERAQNTFLLVSRVHAIFVCLLLEEGAWQVDGVHGSGAFLRCTEACRLDMEGDLWVVWEILNLHTDSHLYFLMAGVRLVCVGQALQAADDQGGKGGELGCGKS